MNIVMWNIFDKNTESVKPVRDENVTNSATEITMCVCHLILKFIFTHMLAIIFQLKTFLLLNVEENLHKKIMVKIIHYPNI